MAGTVRDNALIGQVVANYRVGPLLGRGGMGAVYEVTHQYLGRRAALKVLHSQFAQTPDLAARFVNEARAANLVQHPSVVSVFEIGLLDDGAPYILMEYLDGQTLSQRIRALAAAQSGAATAGRGSTGQPGGSARVVSSIQLVRQLASALHALHERGVIHRDLKPDNVVLVKDPEAPGGERAKLLDFGIAKIVGKFGQAGESPFPGVPAQAKTALGALLGTPVYMGPEQWRGKGNVDHRTDIYALGCIFYELLTGRPPYCASAIVQLMQMHVFQKPPSALFSQLEVPRQVAELVQRMLAKDPEERPTTVQLDQELEQILALGRSPPSAPPAVHQAVTIAMRSRDLPPEDVTIPLVRLSPQELAREAAAREKVDVPRRELLPPPPTEPYHAGGPSGDSKRRKPVAQAGDVVPVPLAERTASGSAQLLPVPRVRWGGSSAWVLAGFVMMATVAVGVKLQNPVKLPSTDPAVPTAPTPWDGKLPLFRSWVIDTTPSGAEVREPDKVSLPGRKVEKGRVLGHTPYTYRGTAQLMTELSISHPGYSDRHLTLYWDDFPQVVLKLRAPRRRPVSPQARSL